MIRLFKTHSFDDYIWNGKLSRYFLNDNYLITTNYKRVVILTITSLASNQIIAMYHTGIGFFIHYFNYYTIDFIISLQNHHEFGKISRPWTDFSLEE